MPRRSAVLGPPTGRAGGVRSAAAGPASRNESAGVDPAAAVDVGMALRVPAFVVITLALSLGAHATAGGGLPSPESAVLIGVLLGIAGRLFALREQSLPRLAAMVWVVQAGTHFVMLAGHQHSSSHFDALQLGGHHLHLARPSGALPPLSPLALQAADLATTANPAGQTTATVLSASGQHGGDPLLMFLLHAVAGLAVAAWLRRGEMAVFHAARRILPRLLPRRRVLPVQPRRVHILPVCTFVRRPTARKYICRATPRRGPPSPAAA